MKEVRHSIRRFASRSRVEHRPTVGAGHPFAQSGRRGIDCCDLCAKPEHDILMRAISDFWTRYTSAVRPTMKKRGSIRL